MRCVRKTAVFVGEPMIELIPDPSGDTALMGVAGDVLNAAIYMRAAAPADWDVSLVSAIGRDTLSDRIANFATSYGLRTDRLLRSHDRGPGLYAISVDAKGERSFSYWRSQSAARVMFGSDDNLDFGRLVGCDLIYFSAITLAILSPKARRGFFDALIQLKDGGTIIAFDSNFRSRLWESTQTARAHITKAHQLAGIAFPSLDDEVAVFSGTEAETIARFISYGATCTFLKRGERGPLILPAQCAKSYR
jgi:2-dehydro-3-deoxygluconokinase